MGRPCAGGGEKTGAGDTAPAHKDGGNRAGDVTPAHKDGITTKMTATRKNRLIKPERPLNLTTWPSLRKNGNIHAACGA